jgi:glycosyltransferase 2 family protein
MGKLKSLFGIFLSIFFLYFFLKNINFREIVKALDAVNYWYIIPLVFANVSTLLIRSIRWHYLLSSIKLIPIQNLFPTAVIGFMTNIVFPARLGEFVRAYILGEKESISKAASFATIVVERLFDGLMISILFIIILFSLPFLGLKQGQFSINEILWAGIIFVSCFIGALLSLILLTQKRVSLEQILKRPKNPVVLFFVSRISKLIHSFSEGLLILKSSRDIAWASFYSFVLWGVYVGGIYLLFRAFNLKLSVAAAIFVQGILAFGVTLPSAPGYVGTFHLACSLGLIYLGVPTPYAQSYSIILWCINIFPALLLGFAFLWKEKLDLKKMDIESYR